MNEQTGTPTRTPAERVATAEEHAQTFAAARDSLEQARYRQALAAGAGPAQAAQDAAAWVDRVGRRYQDAVVRARLALAEEEAAAAQGVAEAEVADEVEASGLRATLHAELDQAPSIRELLTPGWDRWGARDAIGELPGRLPAWVQYAVLGAAFVGMAILTIRGR